MDRGALISGISGVSGVAGVAEIARVAGAAGVADAAGVSPSDQSLLVTATHREQPAIR